MGTKKREAVVVTIPEFSVESMGTWERHVATLLQVSLQMRGLKPRTRIEYRIRHGKESLVEASCEAESIVQLAEVSNG